MPGGADPIDYYPDDDLATIVYDALGSVQYKLFSLMLLMFMFVSSDMFINKTLSLFDGTVDQKCPTSWGTVLQGLFLVLAMVVIDGLISNDII
jgi:hypothetical protein